MNPNLVKKEIMQRVRTVFYLKLIFQPVVLELLAAVAFMSLTTVFVSFGHVIANTVSAPDRLAVLKYFTTAFIQTEFVVQLLVVGTILAGTFLVKDIFRSLKASRILHLRRELVSF